jgi:hypothetical protein
MHTGVRGIKVYPPSKMFAKLVNKNAIKHQNGVHSPKNFHNPYIPSLPKFGKYLMDPLSGFLIDTKNQKMKILNKTGFKNCERQ